MPDTEIFPPRIIILPREMIERIAAGEVIERPTSVVRELIDNALDAGATNIRIELRDGGLRLIRVSDNGSGMRGDEIALACQPHTTSKVRSIADLDRITTLGFRGEALASIATIAEMEVASTADESGIAQVVTLGPGIAPTQSAISRPRGTTVTVRNLFQTIPARRALLRGPQSEAARVATLVRAYALAHPAIRFTLLHNGQMLAHTPGADLSTTISALYSTDVARALLPLGPVEVAHAEMSGVIAARSFSQPTREHITLAINGRPVVNRALLGAIEAGYRPLLRKGRHPILVVSITIPPEAVDANIHPTKAEVLLRQERSIATALREAVYQALGSSPISVATPATALSAPHFTHPKQLPLPAPRRRRGLRITETSTIYTTAQPSLIEESAGRSLPALTPLGQFDETLILAHSAEGHLYLVDQHRAHERILYEQIRRQQLQLAMPDTLTNDAHTTTEADDTASTATAETSLASQMLLEPILIELAPSQAELLLPRLDELARIGLECQPFGGSVFLVRALPSIPGAAQPPTTLARALAEDAAADTNDWLDHVCISLACRSAIRRGQHLSESEQRALLNELCAVTTHALCPHGSPLLLRYTKGFLTRAFEW